MMVLVLSRTKSSSRDVVDHVGHVPPSIETRHLPPGPFDLGDDRHPVWTPDGKRITFGSDRAKPGTRNLYWVNADGTGEPTRLTDSPAIAHARSWHPSGRFLAFSSNDVMVLPMEGDAAHGWTPGTPTAFSATPKGAEWHPMFSPDGRFVAYASSEAAGGAARLDRLDIYVRSFPVNVSRYTQMSYCLPSEMAIATFWPSGENCGPAHRALVARSGDVLPSRVIQA